MRFAIRCVLRLAGPVVCLVALAASAAAVTSSEYERDVHTLVLDHLNGSTLGSGTNVSFESSFPWLDECAFFDGPAHGIDANIQYPQEDLLCMADGTVEAWIWLDGSTIESKVLVQTPPIGTPGSTTFQIGFGSTPYEYLHASCVGTDGFTLQSSEPFPLRTWTHVAVTWGGRGAELWINGILDDTDAATGHAAAGWHGYLIAMAGNMTGRIDEIRVSDVQLPEFPSAVKPASWTAIKAMYR